MLTWEAHTGAVTSLAFVPGGLLSTGTDGCVKHWDSTSGLEHRAWKLTTPADNAPDWQLFLVLSEATGQYAVVGVVNEGVRFLELATGAELAPVRMHRLYALAPSPAGQSVFSLGNRFAGSSWVSELSVPEGRVVAKSELLNVRERSALAVSPDGKQVIARGHRLVWPSGEVAGPIPLVRGKLFAVSTDGDKVFSPAGSRLAVWGFQIGVLRRKIKGHLAPITGLTTTPDGRKLWTCSADATVRQWDVETYHCEKCYGLKIGPLGCVAVSSDGLTAAAGSFNGKIAVWDLD